MTFWACIYRYSVIILAVYLKKKTLSSLFGQFTSPSLSFTFKDKIAKGLVKFGHWIDHSITSIIIHQTHYEKSDWSRAFNQFTIACELDMINAISAADIAFVMSSSTSAWLLRPLECSPQKQNG